MNTIGAPVGGDGLGGLVAVPSQLGSPCMSEQEFSFSHPASPDAAPVQVTAAYNADGQYWRLSASDSLRLALVYKLAWFPVAVRRACETAQACGQPVSMGLTPDEYYSTFRAEPVVFCAAK